jgi:3-hydroxyisobutyrate dehydrogenase-like beta-hydroxyacid dehydrogenase
MIKLLQKDLRIVQDVAARAGLPLEGTALAQRLYEDSSAAGEGDLGTQAMYKVLARRKRPPAG